MRVLVILLFIISCGTYTPKPTIKHVLAVTSEGDTLLLPIDWDSYYYNGWQYNTNVYSNYRTYEPKNNIDNSNNNIKPKYESKDISRLDVNKSKVKK